MQIVISGKNIKVTDSLREYVENKIGRIKRYFDHVIEIDVNLSVQKTKSKEERCIIEVTLWANGISLRGEETQSDLYAAIDMVTDKLEKQIKRYKERIKSRHHKKHGHDVEAVDTSSHRPVIDSIVEVDEEFTEPKIIKSRGFAMKPMSVEEAAEQLAILDQNFVVFTNAKTNRVNVLYRRADGNFGLIEPNY